MEEHVYTDYILHIEEFLGTINAKQWFDQQRASNFIESL
jgi:hypothetical protein